MRESFSLVQNILFIEYIDVVPAHVQENMVEKLWKADVIWFGFWIAYFGGKLWCPCCSCPPIGRSRQPYPKLYFWPKISHLPALGFRSRRCFEFNTHKCSVKSVGGNRPFGKSVFIGPKRTPRGASWTYNMQYYVRDTCTSYFQHKKMTLLAGGFRDGQNIAQNVPIL